MNDTPVVFDKAWTYDSLDKIRRRALLFIADIDTARLSMKDWLELSCILSKVEIARLEREIAAHEKALPTNGKDGK